MIRTMLIQILIIFIQTLTEISGRECQGHDMAIGFSNHSNRSEYYTKFYHGCKVVLKNVEIAWFTEPIDPTFLDSIEEVHGYILVQATSLPVFSMKNLRLIRGSHLHKNHSIHIVRNDKLINVIFPSLREVVKGTVHIEKNKNLCHMNTIDWMDITYRNNSLELKELATNCPSNNAGCSNYWTEEVCQEIWRNTCPIKCPTGCIEGTSICCGNECLGGCRGDSENCSYCKHFKDGHVCRHQCPAEKFYLGVQCLETCPNDTVHHQKSCLMTCPSNHYLTKTAECMECPIGEECPKVCTIHSITTANITKLSNCTIIDGELHILNGHVNSMNNSVAEILELSLSKIREVTATLKMQGKHVNFTNLYSLRNLEIVKGIMKNQHTVAISYTNLKSLNLTKLRKIRIGELRITTNEYLESLDLISLTEVGGSVRVSNNRMLCYIDNSTFHGISSNISVFSNRDPEECKRENKVCDVECKGGCWGPGNGMCRFCQHYRFEETCVPTCDLNASFNAGNAVCKKCHPECHGCSGEGPQNCTHCKNVIEGSNCVERCSIDNFLDNANKSCLPCYSACKNGCSGPSKQFKLGGCNNCHLLLWSENRCLENKSFASDDGLYLDNLVMNVFNSRGIKNSDTVKTLKSCHPTCKSCTGGGTSSDVCTCRHVKYHDHCQDDCPPRHYSDVNHVCQICHPECDECYGPYNDTCHSCKHVRIYMEPLSNITETSNAFESDNFSQEVTSNSEDVDAMSHYGNIFYCSSSCPPDLPSEMEFMEKGKIQRNCLPEPIYGYTLSSITNPKMLTGVLVISGVGLIVVVVIIVAVMRRQKARAESNKAKLEEHMKSMENYDMKEILTPTNVRPDLANIRLIKEVELERGETIGSGAFGTVYRGIWRPEDENVMVSVAIKVLIEGSSSAQHKELLDEARVMASVNHPCCIRILAVCLTRQMMLITPLVVHGSLLDYIRKNGPSIGSYTMLKWATQIARGMNYLEQKGIVHRDLAARNILVQGINQVKITDFGLAKLLTKEEGFLSSGGKVPVKWLALESIQHRIFTHKSDVWSYGVTLWELFTYGKRPYQDVSALDVAEHLENGERLPQPTICTIDVYMVLFKCWAVDTAYRPTFQELEMEFETMSQDSKRFLIIQGDKQTRIPSDFIEDNRSEILRQMRLSDSDYFVCGEDYLDPVFSIPKRLSSKKKPYFLTKVSEEEETSFQLSSEYTNSPQPSFRPSFDHQPSSQSSGSNDGTFSHLVAATEALKGCRPRKSSDRYLAYPNNEYNFKESNKSPISGEKEFSKPLNPYINKTNLKISPPVVDKEGYLEPQSKNLQGRSPVIFMENPEYMCNEKVKPCPSDFARKSESNDLHGPTFGNKIIQTISSGKDYYNEFSDIESKNVEGIAYAKLNSS